ncbi:precorrin-2 C(20)-methyltransferase [Desulfurivibrio sp. D14AmB]|uniref:precorrin-2 C(20)-methyltransferase n=1 Tax=Desulfurivibrio sp. D14AmB TaxID=3374370 RepID=UPI00376ED260
MNQSEATQLGRLFIIGVGPGDPELLTLKAVRRLQDCPVWLVPKGKSDGRSTALDILSPVVDGDGKEIIAHHFPMHKIEMGKTPPPEVARAWQAAAALVHERLSAGRDVAFPTLGDPAIYSTGFYLCETLLGLHPGLQVEIIPGISAMGAAAAALGAPLCLGNERLVVIPATFENGRLRETLLNYDTVVLMKVHRVMPRLVELLRELGLLDKAVLVEKTGQAEERISRDLTIFLESEPHYFSTIIVRKRA